MRTLPLATALLLSTGLAAQLPDGSICPNFTGTDLNGNTHTLYDYLDQGYTVIIDVSATWCGPCWSYHQQHHLKNLYNQYGPGTAEDRVMVLFIEGDGQTGLNQLNGIGGNTQGDWVTGTPYPIIDNASIANLLEIAFFPTVYRVCPNRVVTMVGAQSAANLWNLVQQCPVASPGTNAAMLSYDGETLVCDNMDMPVKISNMGTNPLTSVNVAVKQGGTDLATQTWTGNLSTYDFAELTFNNVSGITNPSAVTVEITTSDANNADNSLNPELAAAPNANAALTFTLKLDRWCSETSWKLFNGNGVQVHAGGPYNCSANGGGPDAETTKVFNWTLPMDCYKLEIYDSYGDGLGASQWGNYPDGNWTLVDGNSTMLFQGSGDFGSLAAGGAKVVQPASIGEQLLNSSLALYPNPTNGILNMEFEMATAEQTTIEVYDLLGQLVRSDSRSIPAGLQREVLDLSNLNNGVYYLSIIAGDMRATRKVTLTR